MDGFIVLKGLGGYEDGHGYSEVTTRIVREICAPEERPFFDAGWISVSLGVEIAWIHFNPRLDAVQITCWDRPTVNLENPCDKETTATLKKEETE
ncbi:MAG: hypothetical protein NTZ04_03850 [Chloroflexi bacterium]|nr:hypothetical protein [Chloroflexota bacterium]